MVGVEGNASELAQLCVVDFLTGETLINKLVQPTKRVIDWRSQYSGIQPSAMRRAVKNNQALRGWKEAQLELWKYIDSNTILVGHSMQHDLKALHLIHPRILDTSIMTRMAVDHECLRNWGLKTLCAELLSRDVQNHGRAGHDCVEDTMATREVFLTCILQPEILARWAIVKRAEEQEKAAQREIEKAARKERMKEQSNAYNGGFDSELDEPSEVEVLRWEDIAEDLGWPHPDTGYDPWSD